MPAIESSDRFKSGASVKAAGGNERADIELIEGPAPAEDSSIPPDVARKQIGPRRPTEGTE